MTDLNTFLAEQGTTLIHKAPREFDESKVKRKGGQFAKKAGPNDTKDEEWLKSENLNKKLAQITKDVAPAFGEVVGAVVKKFGMKSRADLAKNPEARAEAVKAAVQVLNNYAENRGKSPSGEAQIQYRVGNHGKIIAGVVTKDGYKVIQKNEDTSLRLSSSAPSLPKPKPVASTPDNRPPPKAETTPGTKPSSTPGTKPSAASAAKKPPPKSWTNSSALAGRAERAAANAKVDTVLQDFLARQAKKKARKKLKHDDSVSDFLEHFGVKGMRWGLRKENSSSGAEVAAVPGLSGPGLTASEIKEHNDRTAHYAKTIREAKNEAEIEHVLDNAHLNGYMDGNIKVSGIHVSEDLQKVSYEVKLYSLTPGKPNYSSADGVKVEYLNKTVDRLKPGFGWSHADAEASRRKEYDNYVAEQKNLRKARIAGGVAGAATAALLLGHDDPVSAFLEHHGIKGQRWGVRRSDAALGRVARLKQKFGGKKGAIEEAAPKAKASGGDSKPEGGDPKSGGGSDHVAIDHERFVKSLSKSPEQMSDQELREATNRAQALQNYQRIFAPERKSELQAKVDQMNLQKQYRDLNASLNPPKKSALSKLVETSQKGFNTFQTVDKALGGDLSKGISRKLGLKPQPTEHEKAKAAADLAKWKKNVAEDTVKLHDANKTLSKLPKTAAESEMEHLKANLAGVKFTPPPNPLLFGTQSTTSTSQASVTRTPTSHRAPTWLDNLKAANNKPSNDLPTLQDLYKAEAKNRQPDLLDQLKKGRHRK